MSKGEPSDEYKDVSANMRQYGNMRFAQLTLFLVMTAALLTMTFSSEPPLSSKITLILKMGGIVAAIVFWVMEERAADYWHHFCRRAVELEKELDYQPVYQKASKGLNNGYKRSEIALWCSTIILVGEHHMVVLFLTFVGWVKVTKPITFSSSVGWVEATKPIVFSGSHSCNIDEPKPKFCRMG